MRHSAERDISRAEARRGVSAPFGGYLIVRAQADRLVGIDFAETLPDDAAAGTPILLEAERQLRRYFDDPIAMFSLPIEPAGSPFRKKVWERLQAIPPGTTETYGSLARDLASSPRAVGGACRDNLFPIVIPCHRVCGRQGLGGFCGVVDGHFMDIKSWLLAHERRPSE